MIFIKLPPNFDTLINKRRFCTTSFSTGAGSSLFATVGSAARCSREQRHLNYKLWRTKNILPSTETTKVFQLIFPLLIVQLHSLHPSLLKTASSSKPPITRHETEPRDVAHIFLRSMCGANFALPILKLLFFLILVLVKCGAEASCAFYGFFVILHNNPAL